MKQEIDNYELLRNQIKELGQEIEYLESINAPEQELKKLKREWANLVKKVAEMED